jgi:TonB family protein
MERKVEITFPLVILISIFIHAFILITITIPRYSENVQKKYLYKSFEKSSSRNIIVNINQDNISDVNKYTLLSDKDSRAKGYLTKQKGDNWLNNSLKFSIKKGGLLAGKTSTVSSNKGSKEKLLLSKNDELSITLLPEDKFYSSTKGHSGETEWTRIPDKKGVNLKNAIFYSISGNFSFNTKKFKNFKYFHNMKNKISKHWYPPVNANTILPQGGSRLSGDYTPGYTRVMVIPSQLVKMYFVLDRKGIVKKTVIVESMGNKSLDDSCLEAIQNSKNFGPVPEDLKGENIVIPFIFGYIIR